MSFKTERKVGKSTYVYEVTGYRDKDGRVKQHRKYLGVKDPKTGIVHSPRKERWSRACAETSGVTYTVSQCLTDSHLETTLNEVFGEEVGGKVFALGTFCATEGNPMYQYETWAHEHESMLQNAMSSQQVSTFLKALGENERQRSGFWAKWDSYHGKGRNLVFDITSISTYSVGQDFAEWGHNRDHESLPQINLGMVYSDRPGMPLGYRVYPGSVGDVTTLKNLLHYLKHDLHLSHSRMVMDRGFFSSANIRNMDAGGYDYLIPVPSGTRIAKEILLQTEDRFNMEGEYLNFNNRMLAYTKIRAEFAGQIHDFHVFLDFDRRRTETQTMLRKIETIEERFNGSDYRTADEVKEFINSVCSGYSRLFEIKKNRKTFSLKRNQEAIHEFARKFGKMILLPSNYDMEPLQLLKDYFRRDGVEKFFDILKNEMDSKRGRVQSHAALEGRLFVHMIGLIIYGAIMNRLKRNAQAMKFKMGFPEIISNLKRLKRIHSEDGTTVLAELTKKQKSIFQVLDINIPE